MKKITSLLLLLSVIACKNIEPPKDFVAAAETAHSKTEFLKNDAIQFNIVVTFGTKESINGKFTLATDSGKGKIEFKNGDQIIFNNQKVFYSKTLKDTSGVRFDAYTVPYFTLLPYKLSDKGTVWTDYKNIEKDSLDFNTKKLTFTSGTGDAPDDWYVVYTNKKTNLIQKLAYIVTYGGTSQKDAEKEPHAIEYLDYKPINGIQIATAWKIWGWKKDVGFEKQIGSTVVSQIKFIKTTPDFYKPTDLFVEKK